MNGFILGSFLAYSTVTGAATGSQRPEVFWAERLVQEVTPQDNLYASHPTIVQWVEDGKSSARNRSVCSSLITAILEHAYGLAETTIGRWFGTDVPLAIDYENTIAAGRGFSLIRTISEIEPGDVIAIAYAPGSHPTGHVMLVDSLAHIRRATRPIVTGLSQYELTVIDSSHTGHGTHDTRLVGRTYVTGVGRGTLRLYARGDGTIAGYSWSTRTVSHFYGSGEHAIVVGRYLGQPPSAATGSAKLRDPGADDAASQSEDL
jgi:hypothetical protein